MSRGFVKEDDAQTPPIVPPRAALPPGSPNYVTPTGLELLRAELAGLEAERAAAEADRDNDTDRTHRLSLLNGRLALLAERIASAKVVDPRTQPPGEVRFGATVTLRTLSGGKAGLERKFTIVGVDEASVAAGKVGFVAPLARAIIGARLGAQVVVSLGGQAETVEIAALSY
ncbi:GreA/GreB family elongation factor [Hymenobacter sp. BRD67]|uniref:GreA/GreB family elongation factor n=1 Tax=Hymenobacter sp. BRD67 TaxID=2675877 RepID=UPI0015663F21|nr:GreA/GreB family elongation factor [Hymenobacter sp. BRD67]QKG51530.1 GreA/GreB family elongation factor [Hymenobacter sp. BRD67]